MTNHHKQQVQFLLGRYLNDQASEKEEALLFALMKQNGDDEEWQNIIEELMMAEPETADYKRQDWEPVVQAILQKDNNKIHRLGTSWNPRRWLIAASILVTVGVGTILWYNKKENPTVIAKKQVPEYKNDVDPGHNGAVLTLANGQKIILDSVQDGNLAKEGGSTVSKQTGGITYMADAKNNAVVYNTMSTVRGRTYSLQLADGSKVWLNAESSITFPTSFSGAQRKVSITGEVYFEVAHNAQMPFVVQTKETSVEVLGTHFNVNSYEDESSADISLLEGAVRVKNKAQAVVIKPGQQARVKTNGSISVADNADMNEVMGWKENKFYFDNADLKTIMRQFARWYDIDVVYKDAVTNEKFFGIMSRNTSLSNVLKSLQANEIKFTIEGKKLFVQSH